MLRNGRRPLSTIAAIAALTCMANAGPARADVLPIDKLQNVATGYCLDSGGDTTHQKVPASLYRDCVDSLNLEWTYDPKSRQIRNVATGYCLDSGGDTTQQKVPASLYYNCGDPSPNLQWTYDAKSRQIRNVATGYCLDSGGSTTQQKVPASLYFDCGDPSPNLQWTPYLDGAYPPG
ncbi:RICIN domain-containing protein [Streptomyces varsoviensis]|uniref:RICIN domain-containing protein n=1 Tax=Streptomyces varsoviensis TaxID=67373 RepID=UPI0033D50694